MAIEAGIQLHLPSYHDLSFQEVLDIGRTAGAAGFDQIWVTDNMECRNIFVVLAAFATSVPVKLGTAIMAQYFRSPIEAATSLIPVCELMEGRELNVGLGTGNPFTYKTIGMPKPVAFMRQTAHCLGRLLKGDSVEMTDYPLLSEYFNFADTAKLKVAMDTDRPVRIFGGGNGPLGLKLAGELMDGLLFGWTTLPNSKLGKLSDKIAIANNAAEAAGKIDTFTRVTELKISIAKKHEDARQFVRDDPSCARRTIGLRNRNYSEEDFHALGIESADLDKIKEIIDKHGSYADFSDVVTDAMIDASYIAGDPVYCRERIQEVAAIAKEHGFQQLIFSELGPDQVEAVKLISEEILPVMHAAS